MRGHVNFAEFLRCPACGGNIGRDLQCSGCGRKYLSRNDVNVMVDMETTRKEWEWDQSVLSREVRDQIRNDYEMALSEEIKLAQKKWWDVAVGKLSGLSGIIVDVASGFGTMLEVLLSNTEGLVISIDVDPKILLSTKMEFDEKFSRKEVEYLATDAKNIALGNGTVDYITSFAGTNNISDVTRALEEFERILKPGGRIILMTGFVDEKSGTAKALSEYGLIDSYIRGNFIHALENSGFNGITVTEASSATWNDNKMDLFPLEGDSVSYCVVEAGIK